MEYIGEFKAVYRNLHQRKINAGSDLWSIIGGHLSDGKVVIESPGVTHSVNFGLVDVVTNNPTTITKGCKWIKSRGKRKAIGFVGGVLTEDKPTGECLGRLTLDIPAEAFKLIEPRTNERIDFNPAGTYLWFGSDGCEVYKA